MNTRILALLSSVALVAGPAMADDRSSWGGLYGGFHLGGTEMTAETSRSIDANTYWAGSNEDAVEAAGLVDFEEQGFLGGFQLGYNYDWNWLVIGAEADVSFSSIDVSSASVTDYPTDPTQNFLSVTHIDQDWLGTLRLRLGVDLQGALLYATGGLAAGNVEFTQGFSDTATPIPYETLTNDELRTGWAAGGGVEVPVFSGTSLKVEYLRVDLGTAELKGAPLSGYPGTLQTGRADIVHDAIRAGMNWKLN